MSDRMPAFRCSMLVPAAMAVLCLALLGCRPPKAVTERIARNASEVPVVTDSTIVAVAWNVQSGGSDPAVIAQHLSEFDAYDVVCLSEVDPDDFGRFQRALGVRFESTNSELGGSQRLQILYDRRRFELMDQNEFRSADISKDDSTGYSFWVRLRDPSIDTEFVVMTNQPAEDRWRIQQAEGLRDWAGDQQVATINLGTFAIDFDIASRQGDEAFAEMVEDNWVWVEPIDLIDTRWNDRDGDGQDDQPDSLQDMAFVAGPARNWELTCQVLKRDGDFPDTESTSDHRAVALILKP